MSPRTGQERVWTAAVSLIQVILMHVIVIHVMIVIHVIVIQDWE